MVLLPPALSSIWFSSVALINDGTSPTRGVDKLLRCSCDDIFIECLCKNPNALWAVAFCRSSWLPVNRVRFFLLLSFDFSVCVRAKHSIPAVPLNPFGLVQSGASMAVNFGKDYLLEICRVIIQNMSYCNAYVIYGMYRAVPHAPSNSVLNVPFFVCFLFVFCFLAAPKGGGEVNPGT